MKRTSTGNTLASLFLLVGVLLLSCSGGSSTGPGGGSAFNLSVNNIVLSTLAYERTPIDTLIVVTSTSADSLGFRIHEDCDWISLNVSEFALESNGSSSLMLTIDHSSLPAGQHIDTVRVQAYTTSGASHYIVVTLNAGPDNTTGILKSWEESVEYFGQSGGLYCSTYGASFFVGCTSNSGNPIRIFKVQAVGGTLLEERSINPPIVVEPGDSAKSHISFAGCIGAPPPARGTWTLKVGLLVHGEEKWLAHSF